MDGAKSQNNIPPDGGWGWMIVFANALSNTVSLPLLTNFGLIFKDKLSNIGMPVTDITTITSSNSACSMLIGLVTGPLLKYLGYRKVACIAGVMFSTGVLLTAFSSSFSHFILNYSILTASGYGLTNSAFSLALNTYFVKRRSKAAGVAVTVTGLGPIFYPPLITALLSFYGVKGCVIILGGLSLHIVVAALLLQPIKYHWINQTTNEELVDLNKTSNDDAQQSVAQIVLTEPNGGHESNHVSGTMEPKPKSEENLVVDKPIENTSNSHNERSLSRSDDVKTINGSLFEQKQNVPENHIIQNSNTETNLEANLKTVSTKDKETKNWIVRLFDLDLLKDFVFLNIIVGMAIATFAEISFSTLTPFILSEMTFSTLQIATFLSTLSIADIVSRFVSPFVGDYFQISSRVMYMFALLLLIITRMSVIFCDDFKKLVIVSVFLGISKGVRTVYMILVIPNHVEITKLASASGIRMVANGIVLLCLGPVVGFIRDYSGSYVKCIIFMNIITMTCIIMWSIEILYFKLKRKTIKVCD